jgi:hypothetical protein
MLVVFSRSSKRSLLRFLEEMIAERREREERDEE